MLKNLEEYGKFVEITGFRNIKIDNAKAFVEAFQTELPHDLQIQLFDAELVATWQHLYFAVLNALMAFQNKSNLSKSLAVETVLYASAQRQIKKALELVGVKHGSTNVAVLALGGKADLVKSAVETAGRRLGAKPDETVLELTKCKIRRIREAYDILDSELQVTSLKRNCEQALVDLVIERVALLSTRL